MEVAGEIEVGKVPRNDGRTTATAGFLLLAALLLLSVDSFPLGMSVLREFGSRPTNFVLALASGLLVVTYFCRSKHVVVSPAILAVVFVVALAIPALNLPVAIGQARIPARAVLASWGVQYLMLAWGVVSYWTWKGLLSSVSMEFLGRALVLASVLPAMVFLLDYADSGTAIDGLLEVIRRKQDIRPSGLASEPAIFAAWAAGVWPLGVYVARSDRWRLVRWIAWLSVGGLLLSVYLSNARTAAIIAVLQFAYFSYWVLRRSKGGLRKIVWCVALACIGAALGILLLERVVSAVDIESSGSSLARATYTLTGLEVVAGHPLAGVGIGQFTYFFAEYAPALALQSSEVLLYMTGAAESRASTFNMYVRLLVEFGVPLGMLLCWAATRPLLSALRRSCDDPLLLGATMSAIGGIAYWLSQDQYGYQPAIFSLALLSKVLDTSLNTRNPSKLPGIAAVGSLRSS